MSGSGSIVSAGSEGWRIGGEPICQLSHIVQAAVLGAASSRWHPLSVSLALQISGLMIGAVWVGHQRAWSEVWRIAHQWWWLALGALGWGIVAGLGSSTARLGVSVTLAVVMGSQLVAGLVIDQVTGGVRFGLRHVAGALLLLGGVILLTRR